MAVLLSIVGGFALALSFPRHNLWPLAWIALAPLFVVYRTAPMKRSILATLVFGFTFFASLLYWVAIFGYAPCVLLALCETVFILFFGLIAVVISRGTNYWVRLITLPAVWVAVEWGRSYGAYGVAWGSVSQSQTAFLPLAQMASVTGPWGLSFLVVAFNVAVAELYFRHREKQPMRPALMQAGCVLLVVGMISCWGVAQMRGSRTPERTVKVAIIQGNIDQDFPPTESWAAHTDKTMRAYSIATINVLGDKPDLVIWPETAAPGYITTDAGIRGPVQALAAGGHTNMLVGSCQMAPLLQGKAREYNGAFLFDRAGTLKDQYYKVHLVPFGEFVPGRDTLPFLNRYKVRAIDVAPGPGFRPVETDFGKVGVMICFESVFTEIARALTHRGADVLVVMTNDAWFGRTAAAEQHHAMSILRAIENRRYVARCAATGISAVIDPWGRVEESAGIWQEKTIIRSIAPMSITTPYTRWGDWFVWACMILAGVGVAVGLRRGRP